MKSRIVLCSIGGFQPVYNTQTATISAHHPDFLTEKTRSEDVVDGFLTLFWEAKEPHHCVGLTLSAADQLVELLRMQYGDALQSEDISLDALLTTAWETHAEGNTTLELEQAYTVARGICEHSGDIHTTFTASLMEEVAAAE